MPSLIQQVYQKRVQARDAEQDAFEQRVAEYAEQLERTGNIALWQRNMREAVQANIIRQYSIGLGRIPDADAMRLLNAEVRNQWRYLARFADDIERNQMSTAAIAARSQLYSGAGRAAWFMGAESIVKGSYVVYYKSRDGKGTCSPCLKAERGSPYLPNDPKSPYPGSVCLARGRCRCVREVRYDPQAYERLAGRAA